MPFARAQLSQDGIDRTEDVRFDLAELQGRIIPGVRSRDFVYLPCAFSCLSESRGASLTGMRVRFHPRKV